MKPYQDARVEGEKLAKQYAELEKADQVDFYNGLEGYYSVLGHNKKQEAIAVLIEKMLATSGNMTVVIRNMVRDGWISRTCDSKDRRSFFLKLTPAGRRKIEEVLPDHIDSS